MLCRTKCFLLKQEKGFSAITALLMAAVLITMLTTVQADMANLVNFKSKEKFIFDKNQLRRTVSLIMGESSVCRLSFGNRSLNQVALSEQLQLLNPNRTVLTSAGQHFGLVIVNRIKVENMRAVAGSATGFSGDLTMDVSPAYLPTINPLSSYAQIKLPIFFTRSSDGHIESCSVSNVVDDDQELASNRIVEEDDLCARIRGPGFRYDPNTHQCII